MAENVTDGVSLMIKKLFALNRPEAESEYIKNFIDQENKSIYIRLKQIHNSSLGAPPLQPNALN